MGLADMSRRSSFTALAALRPEALLSNRLPRGLAARARLRRSAHRLFGEQEHSPFQLGRRLPFSAVPVEVPLPAAPEDRRKGPLFGASGSLRSDSRSRQTPEDSPAKPAVSRERLGLSR